MLASLSEERPDSPAAEQFIKSLIFKSSDQHRADPAIIPGLCASRLRAQDSLPHDEADRRAPRGGAGASPQKCRGTILRERGLSTMILALSAKRTLVTLSLSGREFWANY
jgi:hypothetical protein